MNWQEFTALLVLATAMSFSPGPNTTLATALAANHGLRRAMPFVCAVPLGWGVLLSLCALGLGALLLAIPLLGLAIKFVGVVYLLWLASKIARTRQLGQLSESGAQESIVGFWQGAALQFVNIKAWMLALAIVSGWIAGRSDPGLRFAVVLPVMLAYAFASNLLYALAGSLLREWLGGPAGTGRRLVWFNRAMGAVLVATAIWMLFSMSPTSAQINKGLWLGLLGIVIFAVTLPMTRLAVGTPDAPQMSGVFIALGRAVLAAGLSALFLLATRAPLPQRQDWLPLAITAGGVVFGFPLFTSIAMRYVEAMHASVMVGVLPLATAAVGALLHRQRPSTGFWLCAALGSALVVAFAMLRSGAVGLSIHFADLLLLAGMLCAAVGYGYGARLSQHMRAEHVICWALVLSLPLTLPLSLVSWPTVAITTSAWAGFAYLGVFSMWLGFFAWYRGLALGGTVRVSQVQLVQPFMSMLFAVPLLGERLDAVTVGFGVAVIATVFIGKKMPVHPSTRASATGAGPVMTMRKP